MCGDLHFRGAGVTPWGMLELQHHQELAPREEITHRVPSSPVMPGDVLPCKHKER